MRTVLTPDASWTTTALLGLIFAVLYGLFFDAWYRRKTTHQKPKNNPQ